MGGGPGRDPHHFGGEALGQGAEPTSETAPPAPEPLSRAPWPAVVLAASILLAFLIQSGLRDVDGWNELWGLRPALLGTPHGLVTLFTCMWSHAGWGHAGANAVFALAFGAPVARLFGLGARGVGLFALFYLVGGVLASLGFAAMHRHDEVVMVGASGAISALTGAAARLLASAPGLGGGPGKGQGRPALAPFTSATVLGMTGAFVVANLILGLVGLDLGQGDAPLAWEAHLAGYAAGLFLIGPFARLAARQATIAGD